MARPGWVEYYLEVAKVVQGRATCLRRRFGAVLVAPDKRTIFTGYNGAPAGLEDCITLGTCWRQDNNIPSGANYERCYSVHAEMNALLHAGRAAAGCTLFLAGWGVIKNEWFQPAVYGPCLLCCKMLLNSGVSYGFEYAPSQECGYVQYSIFEVFKRRLREAGMAELKPVRDLIAKRGFDGEENS